MKLHHGNGPVEVQGSDSTSSFSIALNAKAFRVLSNTLYMNKQGSIVREISCNAYDAHVMAGKPEVPFEIHLPDNFEPWFSVKDFGVGLSPEEITNVFTVYFQSLKDQSNDAIGAFGLGAKTPFAYTDQFTVTSVKNGKKYIYSAYLTESGIPAISEMHQEDSEEPNGVEINLSVKREDYLRFHQEVFTQLKYFKVKPIIHNRTYAGGFEDVYKNVVFQSNHVAILENPGQHVIVQGNVGYPLDVNQLKGKGVDASLLQSTLGNGNQRIFFFNIGEIGVTASREGVEYDDRTVANIKNKLETVAKELEVYVADQLKNLKTDYERVVFLNKSSLLLNLYTGGIANTRLIHGKLTFTIATNLEYVCPNAKVARSLFTYRRHNKISKPQWLSSNSSFVPDEGVVFILRDTHSRCNIRMEQFFKLNPKVHTVIELVPEKKIEEYDFAKIAVQLKKNLGDFDKIQKLSDIPLPVDSSGKIIPVRPKVKTAFWQGPYHQDINQWQKKEEDIDDLVGDFVYVESYYMAPAHSKDLQIISDLRVFYSLLIEKFNYPNFKMIAVRKADLDRVNKKSNFKSLEQFFNELKIKVQNDIRLKNALKHSMITSRYQIESYFKAHARAFAPFDYSHDLSRVFKASNTVRKIPQIVYMHQRMIQICDIKIPDVSKKSQAFKTKVENLMEKYPFLLTPFKATHHTVNYINAMDMFYRHQELQEKEALDFALAA